MKYGSGILFICPPSKKILLGLRNDDELWANFGGMVEAPETFLQCAKREACEETGFIEGTHYKPISNKPASIKVYNAKFTYRCFVAVMDCELKPKLNYEHKEATWFTLNELPDKLHFGIRDLLSDSKLTKKLNLHFNRKN